MNHPPEMALAEPALFELDRRALARSFDRAGGHYEAAAWLQRHARAELLERLAYFTLQPRGVLDLGAGTCQATLALARRYGQAHVFAVDIAPGMLAAAPSQRWRRRFGRICADAHALPLPDQSVDLVYSNLMLQWSDRPDRLFAELARVLRPGGLLAFSSFGPESLWELRDAWQQVDRYPHVSEFPGLAPLGEALMQGGFVEPVLDVESQRRHYPDVRALMRELKQIGAHNAARNRLRGLTGPRRLQGMIDAYERRREPAGVPATWQLLYGAAFRGEPRRGASAPGPDGEITVPLQALRRRRGGAS